MFSTNLLWLKNSSFHFWKCSAVVAFHLM